MRKILSLAAMLIALLTGATALVLFGRSLWTAGGAPVTPVNRNLDQELTAIYAPAALIQFAKTHDPGSIGTNDELARLIEQEGLQSCWMITLTYWSRGDGSYMPVILHPGDFAYRFPVTRACLQAMAGNPAAEYAKTRIVVIPEHLLAKAPLDALPELLRK